MTDNLNMDANNEIRALTKPMRGLRQGLDADELRFGIRSTFDWKVIVLVAETRGA
jgi:hypothetical protein